MPAEEPEATVATVDPLPSTFTLEVADKEDPWLEGEGRPVGRDSFYKRSSITSPECLFMPARDHRHKWFA